MIRRGKEPEEVLGPVIDGHDQLARLEMFLSREDPGRENTEMEEAAPEPVRQPILLICGDANPAAAVAALARDCGFEINVVLPAEQAEDSELISLADKTLRIEEGEDILQICEIDRDHYVCIFEKDQEVCESLLMQFLASEAAYIGAWANMARADAIIDNLKADGAPDAELAAVCCPMGLGIGANTAQQEAVAVVAELMAAKSGALKRLRYLD